MLASNRGFLGSSYPMMSVKL